MPLTLYKKLEDGMIGLWKISEEPDELEQLARLSLPDLITYSGISALHRKKEWLATRALLRELLENASSIHYHNDGRPYLENGKYNISISHTIGFVAIMLNEFNIPGIDIELANRQVGRVASRFLSPEEIEICRVTSEFSNDKLLLHWCAKEAIFKMIPFSNVEFSTDIQIALTNTTNDTGLFQGLYMGKTGQIPIRLEYLKEDGVMMVWGLISEIR